MSDSISEAVRRLGRGELVLLHDNAGPDGSYYLLAAGEFCTAQQVSFMVNAARGVILAAVSEDRLHELGLQAMSPKNRQHGVDFSVSVEARRDGDVDGVRERAVDGDEHAQSACIIAHHQPSAIGRLIEPQLLAGLDGQSQPIGQAIADLDRKACLGSEHDHPQRIAPDVLDDLVACGAPGQDLGR